MPKRKTHVNKEESDEASLPGEEGSPSSARRRGPNLTKETGPSSSAKNHEEGASDEDEEQLPPKKAKITAKKPRLEMKGSGALRVATDGSKYADIGKKKRVTVRSFKGVPLVDIREFYGADGDEKPGKKGISLNIEQWNALKECMSAIDKSLAELS